MVYIFKDDGYPEAREFEDNYLRVDGRTPANVDRMLGRTGGGTNGARSPGPRRFTSVPPCAPRSRWLHQPGPAVRA